MLSILFIKELCLTNITWQMNPNWLAYEHSCGLKTGLRTINKRANAINLSSWNRHSRGIQRAEPQTGTVFSSGIE